MKSSMQDMVFDFFQKAGYQMEKNVKFSTFSSDFFGFSTGHSLGKLFPYEDYLFFHFEVRDIANLHEKAREHVDTLFKLPKWARYKVPNIATIAFSDKAFSDEDIEAARKPHSYGVGGEKHSTYLIDLSAKTITEAGVETVSVRGTGAGTMNLTFQKISPTNRIRNLVIECVARIL